jgi:hypothetical protein
MQMALPEKDASREKIAEQRCQTTTRARRDAVPQLTP